MKNNKSSYIVQDGYNQIASVYHNQRDKYKSDDVLNSFVSLLPKSGDVLDVGCGAGVPVARSLVDSGFRVTGIDISSSMIKLARINVSEANFTEMDMRKLKFDSSSFDGITAFYSLFHVPMDEHPIILSQFHRLLRRDGILLFCSGSNAWEGTKDYHGAQMFWSHPESNVTRKFVIEAGFNLIMSEVREYNGESHYWIIAKKSHNPRCT